MKYGFAGSGSFLLHAYYGLVADQSRFTSL